MGYLTISTNVRRYQTHHRWQFFAFRKTAHRCIVRVTQSNWVKMWFSCFFVLPGSAEAQVIWSGIVKRLLIAYFIGNISAKKYQKSIHLRQSYSKPKVRRFLRHGYNFDFMFAITPSFLQIANIQIEKTSLYVNVYKFTVLLFADAKRRIHTTFDFGLGFLSHWHIKDYGAVTFSPVFGFDVLWFWFIPFNFWNSISFSCTCANYKYTTPTIILSFIKKYH